MALWEEGGHSSEILKRIPKGHLYAFDRDISAIKESTPRLQEIGNNFTCIHSAFSNLKEELHKLGVDGMDGMLLDLGVSSPQFDEADRGFSYRFDAPLDMRMDQSQELSAYTIVNTWSYEELVSIFIAMEKKIFRNRLLEKSNRQEKKRIETTGELVEIIKSALPMKVLNKKDIQQKSISGNTYCG